ncbi:origin recognition complex subunit 2-domain-containing protein, partial [Naematelia encephala]
DDSNASASHLVSFLTGYDSRPVLDGDAENEEEDENGDGEGHQDASDDEEDYDDPDEDVDATPTKRGKQGLVGSAGPSSAKSTPRSTPTKSRKTPTPRKVKPSLPFDDANGPSSGFVRPSKSDAYLLHASRSSRTSGNSYSSLARPLSQAKYEQYAASARSNGKSRAVVEDCLERLSSRFSQWELELEEGFNILGYGFGSKRHLLNRFVTERLSRIGHCVVINGHFPQLGIRDVLSQIEDTLSIPQDIPVPPSASTPLDRSAYRTYAYFLPSSALPGRQKPHETSNVPLYLVIHNIDSPSLRTPRSLGILSLLASSPRIHIIASFDHLNTPLLFSAASTNHFPHTYEPGSWTGTPPPGRGFNWIYHNMTTFDDYDLELTYQRLSASNNAIGGLSSTSTGGISEEGALQILRSVPPMALRLLKLLLTKQLAALPPEPSQHVAHPASQTAPVFAIDNDTLQRLARERFIAREEERYNALMGEFRDHGLVVEALEDHESRTGRWVWVPLGKAAVERVLETMDSVE